MGVICESYHSLTQEYSKMTYKVNNLITTAEAATYDKHLVVALKAEGFSFAITTSCGKLLTFADIDMPLSGSMSEISSSLKALFAELKLMTFGYKQSTLVVPSELSTWVPDHLYEPARDMQYLAVVGKVKPGTGVFSAPSPLLKSQGVFSGNSTAVAAFRITFPGIKVVSQHHRLVSEQFLQESAQHPVMVLFLRDSMQDLSAYKDSKLQIINTYSVADPYEGLYKSLQVMKTLSLESPDLTLYLCGNVNRVTYAAFRNYFPIVKLYNGRHFDYLNPEFQHLHTYKEVLLLQ